MPNELKELDPVEVSLVEMGANLKKFLLLKSMKGGDKNLSQILKVLNTPLESEAAVNKFLADKEIDENTEAAAAIKGTIRLMEAFADTMPEDILDQIAEITGLTKSDDSFQADPQPVEKRVVAFQDLPLAARDREWDGDAAVQSLQMWAGPEDKEEWTEENWNRYRQAFLTYNEDEPNNFTSYSFPIAEPVGGELMAIPRGIFAAAAALQGARLEEGARALNVGTGEIDDMKSHLTRYYGKMREMFEDDSIRAPWDEGEIQQSINTGVVLQSIEKAADIDSLPVADAIKEQLRSLWKEREQAQEELRKAKEEKVKKEYIAKAAELDHLSIKPDEFGLVLKSLGESSQDNFGELMRVLRGANNALKLAGIMGEVGSSMSDEGGSAWEKIQKAAVAKANEDGITKEQAVSKLLQEQPELYRRYMKEKERE